MAKVVWLKFNHGGLYTIRHCPVNRSFIDCDVVRRVDGRQGGETRGCEVERASRNVSQSWMPRERASIENPID